MYRAKFTSVSLATLAPMSVHLFSIIRFAISDYIATHELVRARLLARSTPVKSEVGYPD